MSGAISVFVFKRGFHYRCRLMKHRDDGAVWKCGFCARGNIQEEIGFQCGVCHARVAQIHWPFPHRTNDSGPNRALRSEPNY